MPPVDVVVVGAGPAGATAARTLALGGARVRLIDRARFPRNKPCGGAISTRALARFPFLGRALEGISTRYVSRLRLESPAGEVAELSSDQPAALMIRRVEFDERLVRLAQEAGAELVEGMEVTGVERTADAVVLTSRGGARVRASYLVAADGANSVVSRRLGLNPGWRPSAVALDMMEETPFESLRCADPDALWVSYGYRHAHGYAYVFPKERHVNVGVGFVLQHYRTAIEEAPYQVQTRFIARLREEGVLVGDSGRQFFTPALIPIAGPLRRTVAERVTAIGDAGGFVNGFSAEGIYYAMVSGELAAGAILEGNPAAFERAWRAEVGAELRDAVRIQRYLFGRLSRIDAMVRGARTRPRVARRVVDYAMGRGSYRRLRLGLLGAAPLFGVALFLNCLDVK